jgi:glycosyltransferase involved in cell wall biosynthesis
MTPMEISTIKDVAPLVSVAITAYNLDKLLPKAIESALMQCTPFAIEIIISNDCSIDDTEAIANAYQSQYPGKIRVLNHTHNLGLQRNMYTTFDACRGKYVAWLDADDQWTDPDKLAIQVAALEADPTIAVCTHYVRYVNLDGEVTKQKHPSLAPGRYGLNTIVRSCFPPTPSAVFRNGLHRQLPDWYFKLESMSDWPLWMLAAQTGDIVLLDRVMADYTLSPNSIYMSKGLLFGYTVQARFYELAESLLPPSMHRLARSQKGKLYEEMAYYLRKEGRFKESRQAAFKAISSPSIRDNTKGKIRVSLALLRQEIRQRFSQ